MLKQQGPMDVPDFPIFHPSVPKPSQDCTIGWFIALQALFANRRLMIANQHMNAEINQLRAINANTSMSATQKCVLAELRAQGSLCKKDETGYFRANIELMAEHTGYSPDTIGKTVKDLSEQGVILRKTKFFGGKRLVGVCIPDETEDNLADIKLKTPRNHGGKRTPRCKTCGSQDITIQYICKNCGTIDVVEDEQGEGMEPQ